MSYSDTGTVIATSRGELPVADQFFLSSELKEEVIHYEMVEVYKINTHIIIIICTGLKYTTMKITPFKQYLIRSCS